MWEFMAIRPHETTVPPGHQHISLATLCARPHLLSPPPTDPRAQGSQGSHWPKGLSKHAVELGLDPSWRTPAGSEGMPSLQTGTWVQGALSFPLVKVRCLL